MNRLGGKVAVITGGAAGMGRIQSELYASEGAQVAVVDVNEQEGRATADAIRASGGVANYWKLDVSDESEVETVVSDIAKRFGAINVLVNNAGVTGADKPTHEIDERDLDLVLSVDVKGVFFMTKHCIPYLKHAGGGAIVNFASIYGLVGSQELTPYHAAKGAVVALTKQDAVTYGPSNIRVNAVAPGTILTPLVKELGSRGPDGLDGYTKLMGAKHPLGRVGTPEEVAAATLFLASEEASFITGAVLPVDGGYTAQ
ncbi:SDR family NAD(P)-dependent oxidoreductase [Brevibacterium spongiae]|uniref:SDR family oxidoreductase n=1 Tax=Brevibacterium spongiae TaxID=2909672 RepID=A0ABY5SJY0_9MICO|nr:SDR family NAD(P)-dependent oxidoreductase [Brevibacterium spongiae]UVI34762.1 SDR family oxidoreductase [Brevibacterium spongiae]